MVRTFVGRFQIEHQLASYDAGSVYRAKDPKTERTLAVRTLRIDSDPGRQLLPAFQQQAKSAAALNSPNIAAVIGGGANGELFFVVLEYVEGATLRSMLDRGQTFSPWDAIDLTRQVCTGLDHAHHRGVVHPNLHPGNIIVELDGTAKIMDFGIPKSVSAACHPGGPDQGLFYASPEQVRGEKLDSRSNLFSWGAILYEAFTGHRPFAAESPDSLSHEILETDPPAPRELCPAVSRGISAVVMKALAKDPGKRYQHASELVSALENYRRLERPAPAPLPVEAPLTVQPPAVPAVQIAPALPERSAAEIPAPLHAFASPEIPMPVVPAAFVLESALESAARPADLRPAAPQTTPLSFEPVGVLAIPASTPETPARPLRAVTKALSKAVQAQLPPQRRQALADWLLKKGLSYAAIAMSALTIVFVTLGAIYFVQQQIRVQPGPQPAPARQSQPAQVQQPPVETAVAVPVDPAPVNPAPVIVVPTAPVSVKPYRRKAAAVAPKRVPAIATGEMAVNSIPDGALVQIDGQSGPNWVTPFIAGNLSPGPHAVVLTKPGFTTHPQTAQVEAGRRSLVAVSLTELGATVFVSSDPSGAAVIVDGQDSGKKTPTHVVLAKGRHAFSVRKAGFFEFASEAQLAPGQSLQLNPTLKMMGNTDDIKTSSKLKLFGNRPRDMASLQIKTRPKGARVVINSREMDKTTPAEFFLHPGTYEIQITAYGYRPLRKMVSLDLGAKVFVIDEELEK